MLRDLQFAVRQLLKTPVFTMIAVLTIALGIGANTAIFSVVNGVLLNPLPYRNADRIVVLFAEIPNFRDGSISYPNFLDWQRMNHSFARLAAYRPTGYNLAGRGEPEHLQGEMISAGFFETFGVNPILGRTFQPEDDRRGAAPAVMISEGLWRRKFSSSRGVIGQRLVLDGEGRTIVGVVPGDFRLRIENFQDDSSNEVYTPIGEYNNPRFYADRGAGWGMKAVGLLRPGVAFEPAQQDMARVTRELAAAYPLNDSNERAYLVPLKENMVGNMRVPLLVLLGAVFLVLLISCVNVANLLLARSTAREREFAIRAAIGAAQWHVIRQLLTESILLAAIGGGLGLLLAQAGTVTALAAVPHTLPRAESIGIDMRVLLFTTVLSLLAGAAFGLAPALRLRTASLGGTLKESGRSVTGSRNRTQRVFVMVEMALALVLLVGAGLMIRTLFALWKLDPGFRPEGVLTFTIAPQPSLRQQDPAAIRTFLRQLTTELGGMPEVEGASLSAASAPMGSDNDWHISFPGRPKPASLTDLPMALAYVVQPEYLQTMGLKLRRGRFLAASDDEHATPAAVVDETLAAKYFPGTDAIGQYLDLDIDPTHPRHRAKPQIVGVVGHLNQWGLGASETERPLHAQMFLSLAQMPDADLLEMTHVFTAYVRGRHGVTPDFEATRQRLLTFNRDLVVFGSEPLARVVSRSVAAQRFTMSLLSVFAGLALLLASIGIYGVLSYLVGQRTREIGIRIALGAPRRDVLRIILGDGARMTLTGMGIGVLAALALTQLMSSMLFGVRPADLVTFALVVVTLCSIAFLACFIPARRAMNVDPVIILRDE